MSEQVWKDLLDKENHTFADGSNLTQIHSTHEEECYSFTFDQKNFKHKKFIVSEDHYLLCDVSKVHKDILKECIQNMPITIPLVADYHIEEIEEGVFREYEEIIEDEPIRVDSKTYWLNAYAIYWLFSQNQKVRVLNKDNKKLKILDSTWVGKKDCFCVSTNTGRYEVCGVINHNSVTLRNVIFHSLTHSDDIKLGLVDLKLSEFSRYKDMNNVVGVANSVLEAAELLRLSRETMRKRNLSNAEKDLTDFKDYKPKKPTNKIRLYGREFDEDYVFDVKINGEDTKMTAKELLEKVNS